MCNTQTTLEFYKVLSIASPFISALLASLLTYYFTLKTKRFDILYENKIPAFKEISIKLIEFKKFCNGRVAYFIGNEYSPYYEANAGTLHHRTEIAQVSEFNSIFLSTESRSLIEDLLNQMSGLCNAEVAILSGDQMPGIEKEYERLSKLTENCISKLYSDLNLKA
jgi:hypothetical protein